VHSSKPKELNGEVILIRISFHIASTLLIQLIISLLGVGWDFKSRVQLWGLEGIADDLPEPQVDGVEEVL